MLAEAGVHPDNLRIAAALGREDLVRHCFAPDGGLTSRAASARAFYRPHSGFPQWRPSDDPQEVLDEALVWAAKSDRVTVMPLLVERGARVNADPYRGTPLGWPARNGRLTAARWLLDNGADIDLRATFGGLAHGVGITALHLAAQSNHAAMVELLLSRAPTRRSRTSCMTALPSVGPDLPRRRRRRPCFRTGRTERMYRKR